MTVPEKIYTERDITRARRKAKAVGWLQGGGVVVAGAVILNLIGWIPTILVVVIVAYGVFRLLSKKPSRSEDDSS